MAAVTNTFGTFSAKGIREDLSNLIYQISPEDTPVMSAAGREKADNTLFEWQTDALASTDTGNAVIEGDDVTSFPATTATARVGNYTQISRKLILISGTLEVVDKAGRKSEESYQAAKRSAELKRDMEAIINQNIGGGAGSASVARQTATMGAWIKTNVNFDTVTTPGVSPTYTAGVPGAARTDGTLRTYTEAIMQDVVQKGWTAGANIDKWMHLVGPINKARVSGFSGVATKTYYQSAKKAAAIIGAADVYVSNFGTFSVMANRFQREVDGWFIDPAYVALAYLRPFKTIQLAKTGDAEKRMLLVEWGLKMKNEAAHGLAADLTTT